MNNNHHSPSANENNIAITAKALPARDPRFPAAFKKLFKRIFILFDGALRKPSTACVLEKKKKRKKRESESPRRKKKRKYMSDLLGSMSDEMFLFEKKKLLRNTHAVCTTQSNATCCLSKREREREKERKTKKKGIHEQVEQVASYM